MVQEDVKKDVVEEVKKEEVPIEHEYSPIEKQAMGRGWKPKDQWEGDPDEWRSAKEHVERGEMIGKIIAQGRELEDLKRAVNFMTDNQRKQFNAGYAKAIEEEDGKKVEETWILRVPKDGSDFGCAKDEDVDMNFRSFLGCLENYKRIMYLKGKKIEERKIKLTNIMQEAK